MGRGLAMLGAILLLSTLALWIGDAVGLVTPEQSAAWSPRTLKAGGILLAVGIALRVIYPLRRIVHAHCPVCGHAVERGHVYCLDHRQSTVNSYRDQNRDRVLRGGKLDG